MLKKHNFWYAMASLTSSNHKGSVNNCTAVAPSDLMRMMMMNHRYEGSTATHPKALSEWDGLDPSRSPCGANNEAEWDKMWIRLTAISQHKSALFFGSQQGIQTVATKSAVFQCFATTSCCILWFCN